MKREKFDVIVIGAATSGAFFARKMAEKGFTVKVVEKLPEEKVGTRYDIFHIVRKEFTNFDLPRPRKGDKEWAFEHDDGFTASPYGHYKKHTTDNVVGLHMHEYTLLMNRWAQAAGATIEYNTAFKGFIFENDRISGIKCDTADGEKEYYARCVVDCSGSNAEVRRALPDSYGMDKFKLSDNDKFFVTLKYIKIKNKEDQLKASCGCPYYKSWIALDEDPSCAIVGIGSTRNYEYGEEILKEYLACVPIPEHEVIRVERGTTPYCRSPYSFVADGFIVTGDAACLTKPMNGEGVTSSMVHMTIAADVLSDALKETGYITKEKLWKINNLYYNKQGADFSSTRALMINVIKAKKSEFEYFFSILPESLLQDADNIPGFKVPTEDLLKAGSGILKGVATGNISKGSLRLLINGIKMADKIKKHYLAFPKTPEGFTEWKKTADIYWEQTGKME